MFNTKKEWMKTGGWRNLQLPTHHLWKRPCSTLSSFESEELLLQGSCCLVQTVYPELEPPNRTHQTFEIQPKIVPQQHHLLHILITPWTLCYCKFTMMPSCGLVMWLLYIVSCSPKHTHSHTDTVVLLAQFINQMTYSLWAPSFPPTVSQQTDSGSISEEEPHT